MRTALITGGTDGIGKATARKLLLEGWKVVIIGRSSNKCDATVSYLKTISKEISAIVCDLSELSDVKIAVDTFLNEKKRFDVLLSNANAIASERILTPEGNEQNFALGYLSRILMINRLLPILNQA